MVHISKLMGMALFIGVLLLFWAWSLSAQETAGKTIDCPQCGYSNDWSSNFCIKCGQSLEAAKLKAEGKSQEAEKAQALEKAETPKKAEKAIAAEA